MDNDDFINLDEMDEALSAFDGVAALCTKSGNNYPSPPKNWDFFCVRI